VSYAGALAVRSGLIMITADNRILPVIARWTAED
jgi:hypothetical protein